LNYVFIGLSVLQRKEDFAKLIIEVMHTSLYNMARGDDMDIEIAILVAGALAMVGGIVGGGAIYAGLEKLAKALKQK